MWFSQSPVYLFKTIYPKSIFTLNQSNEILLTFDDGPIPQVTEYVLDVLKHYHIPAHFFCVGNNVQKHFDVFEKILADGHHIGNHTYSHLNGWKTTDEEYLEDVKKFETLHPTKYFRPPYGKIKYSQYLYLINKGYHIVFWSVISYDYHHAMTVDKCMKILKKHTIGGQIILFHDSEKSFRLISKILPEYIEHCLKLKLIFMPLKN